MPNWSTTSFTVRGPQDEIEDFYNGVMAEVSPEKKMCILTTYVPCPEELNISSTYTYEEIPEQWAESVADGTWTKEDYDKRVADNSELQIKQQDNLKKYGSKDWYDWQHENWGVKWGDCDTYMDSPYDSGYNNTWMIHGGFQTAWGTATQGWQKVSERFPKCLFEFHSDEEAGFFAGTEATENGDLVFEDYYEPTEYPEEVDWDDEDSTTKFEDWKDELAMGIASRYKDFLKKAEWIQDEKPLVRRLAIATSTKPHFWK